MLHGMKSGALLLGSFAMIAATPSTSSAGFFPWLYDSLFGPAYYDPWYGGGSYAPYGVGYGPRAYRAAYYAAPAWDCGCEVACAPCNACPPCSPCGPAGCPGGNCQWNAPAGQPMPMPDSNMNRDRRSAPPPTYETPPQNGVDMPLPRRSPGSRPAPGSDPADDEFRAPRTSPRDSTDGDRNRDNETGNDTGANSGSTDAQKPILGSEIVIPQKKPADAAPVKEENDSDDADKITIPDKSASKPVIEKHRMTLRASFTAPRLVRTLVRPATEWSAAPADARIARH